LLNKKVVGVEVVEGGVRVRCGDGVVFEGSIVVGADGIHSRVRKEMQRLAPQGLIDRDLKSRLFDSHLDRHTFPSFFLVMFT
jgi:2-polyprenyl-6-methoxyphenol hydroxylase-like FAD-dependent oxidoreductase